MTNFLEGCVEFSILAGISDQKQINKVLIDYCLQIECDFLALSVIFWVDL